MTTYQRSQLFLHIAIVFRLHPPNLWLPLYVVTLKSLYVILFMTVALRNSFLRAIALRDCFLKAIALRNCTYWKLHAFRHIYLYSIISKTIQKTTQIMGIYKQISFSGWMIKLMDGRVCGTLNGRPKSNWKSNLRSFSDPRICHLKKKK